MDQHNGSDQATFHERSAGRPATQSDPAAAAYARSANGQGVQGTDQGQGQGDADDEINSMEALLRSMDDQQAEAKRGDILEGEVVRIDRDGILVDIHMKSEGIIPGNEAQRALQNPNFQIRIGDSILVYVVQPENQEGQVVLSFDRARNERGWRSAQKYHEDNQTIEAPVVDHNKGGLIVDVEGVRGFVPISQVASLRQSGTPEETEQRLAGMVGQKILLKVLEINRRRNRLILSERAAVQERRGQRKDQLLMELEEGQVRKGRVSSICDFGAFVDLGGADGLVHLSELSWGSVSNPGEVVKVGDEVEVYVLSVDRDRKKIALSLRRVQPEPWSRVAEKYQVGDTVQARVTKLANFGAFARIEDGIEGLIHVSEMSDGHVTHPKSVVKEGDEVTVRIIRIEPDRRRLGLSLKTDHVDYGGGLQMPPGVYGDHDPNQQYGDGQHYGDGQQYGDGQHEQYGEGQGQGHEYSQDQGQYSHEGYTQANE